MSTNNTVLSNGYINNTALSNGFITSIKEQQINFQMIYINTNIVHPPSAHILGFNENFTFMIINFQKKSNLYQYIYITHKSHYTSLSQQVLYRFNSTCTIYINTKPLLWRRCWTPRVCPRPSQSDRTCAGHSHSPGSSGSWPYPPPPQTVSISRLVTRTQSTALPRQTGSFWPQWIPDYRPHQMPGTWEQDQDRVRACLITLTLAESLHSKEFEVCYPLWCDFLNE